MKTFLPTAKLWKYVAILLCFDVVLIYIFIFLPAAIATKPPVWDFRIEALRQLEDQQSRKVVVDKSSVKSADNIVHSYFPTDSAAKTIQPFWQSLPALQPVKAKTGSDSGRVL